MNKIELTRWIKAKSSELGFERCGIAAAGYLDVEAPRLNDWLAAGMNGEMDYLAERLEVRLDPRNLLPGAQSVICFAQSYHTDKQPADATAPRISSYARGGDYHRVLKNKVGVLLVQLRSQLGEFQSAVAVDSGAVLEKAWGARAGIGWVGKNSILIHKEIGSFMFLAIVVVDFELEYDHPLPDSCAHCTACLDACPTAAIVRPHVVDARKCIAYLTIETKHELPVEMKGKLNNWAYGCDICQDVCPWNRKAPLHHEPQFEPSSKLYEMSADEWWQLTPEKFRSLFAGTPLARGGYARLRRNLDFLETP
jgi:epoxyqueuosine reductase